MRNGVKDLRFVMRVKEWAGWLDNEIVIVSVNVINYILGACVGRWEIPSHPHCRHPPAL
jgi:hypothetical protein